MGRAYIRDRIIVLGSLAILCLLAWFYLFYLVWQMDRMPIGMAMVKPQVRGWDATELLLCFIMWAIMMVGMMIPSAAPMIVIFNDTSRKRRQRASPFPATGLFILGYVAVWSAFSAVATVAQWGLQTTTLLSPTLLKSTNHVLAGTILVAAGVFQWTPLKDRCLTHCRSPLNFLLNEWRDGNRGAWIMGLRHGLFCLGCCWALMGLLFVTGVMNLFWVALIAIFVLAEKVAPRGRWVSAGAGTLLTAWGIWMLLAG